MVGSRLGGLLGALVAASFCFAWLRSRGLDTSLCWTLALLWLLDPLNVQNYRHARVDVWAQACCFASALFLSRYPKSGSRASLVAAGGLALAMVFTWPAVVLLSPLLIWALAEGLGVMRSRGLGRGELTRALGAFGIGAVVCGALILLPIAPLLPRMWNWLIEWLPLYSNLSGWSWSMRTASVLSLFGRSPLWPLAAALALAIVPDRRVRLTVLVAAASVFLTKPYLHRVVYLGPFMVLCVATALSRPGGVPEQWVMRLKLLTSAALAWAVLVSLVARPALALIEKDGRDPWRAVVAARSGPIQRGDTVWMGTWQIYFAGRAQGWKMLGPAVFGTGRARQAACLRADYAVVRRRFASPSLEGCGLEWLGFLDVGREASPPSLAQGYGPYALWGRITPASR